MRYEIIVTRQGQPVPFTRAVNVRPAVFYVGRPSPLGNPYKIGADGDRTSVLQKYDAWFRTQIGAQSPANEMLDRIEDAATDRPVVLVCWCKPEACHGDIIKAHIERRLKGDLT